MKRFLLSICVAVLAVFGLSLPLQAETVIWEGSTLHHLYDGFESNGVRINGSGMMMSGFETGNYYFSTSLGTFSQVVVEAFSGVLAGPGWNYTNEKFVWNGSASNVSFTVSSAVNDINRITFTIDVPSSGTCGDNLTWEYDKDSHTLTISGSGNMDNYSSSSAPWNSFRYSIQRVVLSEGVQSIGSGAFAWHSYLESIEIPSTLTTIGQHAFNVCNRLRTLFLPASLQTIEHYAFQNCTALTDVTVNWTSLSGLSLGNIPFNSVNTSNVRLIVPSGTESMYAAASPWSGFNITTGYASSLKAGTMDASSWKLSPSLAVEGATVTAAYSGSKDVESVQAMWSGTGQVYNYTGTIQTFTAPSTGTYELRVWGAQGGNRTHYGSLASGGRGGYASCRTFLTAGETLYIYVGGQGENIIDNGESGNTGGAGGWNGGGNGGTGWNVHRGAAGGGGATHVSKVNNQVIRTNVNSLVGTDYIIVAGGGGGAGHPSSTPGAGGGTTGGFGKNSLLANYSSNWYWNTNYSYGRDGGNAGDYNWGQEGSGGGGGGYYGGNANTNHDASRDDSGGCGGSSYYNHYLASEFSTTADQREGNGQAEIVIVGLAATKTSTNHYQYTLPAANVDVEVVYGFAGSGTEENPYLISSTEDWNLLADKVNAGSNYAGKYFRQTGDFTITRMVGATRNADNETIEDEEFITFNGTYDGYGHTLNLNLNVQGERYVGPFHCVSNATIKNLVVTGSVTVGGGTKVESSRHPSALVGCCTTGSCVIENCLVSANVSGADYMGGLIGHSWSANVTFTGCVYTGTLTPTGSNDTGGLIGWGGDNGGMTYVVTNCLFAGSYSGNGKFHPIGILTTTVNNPRTITNVYYTAGLNKISDDYNNSICKGLVNRAKFAYSITPAEGITVANAGSATEYTVSGITSYGVGIKYNNVLYGGNGDVLSLNLSGSSTGLYAESTGSLSGSSNPYSLTMAAANCVISEGEPVVSITTAGNVTTQYATLSSAVAAWEANSTLTLLADVTTSSTIVVNNTSTLDLNGHGIKMTGSGNVIRIGDGKTLTLNDSDPTTTHKFTVDNTTLLATLDEANGTLTINGGYITGGYAIYGCAIDCSTGNGAHFVMNGGTLIGNRNNGLSGNDHSVVCVGRDAVTHDNSFTMNGGAICYNDAAGIGALPVGTATLSNATIHHNQNVGINMWYTRRLTLNNVEITNNKDGGIGMDTRSEPVHIQGRTIIADNTVGDSPRDIKYNDAGARSLALDINGPLHSEARIGIYYNTSNVTPGVFTSGLSGNGDASNFYSNLSDYGVKINGDGEATMLYLAAISSAPTAKTGLVANGEAQTLINAGTASGGTMWYKVGDGEWSADLPTATEYGNYTVYYKVVGDANHADFTPAENSIAVSIKRTVYLVPGVWATDNAQFAAYVFNEGEDGVWSAIMTPTADEKAYKADVFAYEKIIFVRLKNTATMANWDDKWNQTDNLTLPTDNCYQITGWGGSDGRWRNYPFYYVQFQDYDETVLKNDTVDSGNAATAPATPTRTGYHFTGWDQEIDAITSDLTVKAQYEINKYTITWENEDGTTLETDENVEYGATPSYDGATPTKEATAQYTYTFDKWSPAVAPVTGNATYTATYSSTVNQYTVIFYDEDGTTELQKQTLDYGATITQPSDPTKAATAQYTYTFNGWSPAFTPGTTVTGNAEFVATYSSTINKYTIVWENENGTTLETDENVEYGATPSYDGATPTKEATAQYTYTFDKWSPAVAPVTGNATYTATYSSTVNQYTVIFYDEDGTTELQKQTLDYGATITPPSDPTKAATAQYTYTFNGWSPTFTPGTTVTGNATFTATYSSTINKYTIVWENEDGTTLETDENVEYGATPSYDGVTPTKEATAQYTYTFDKWSPAVAPVTGNATYTATYSSTVNQYTVIFYDEDGTSELKKQTLDYGATITQPSDPTKAATAQYTYTFNGWSPAFTPGTTVTGDAEFVATYSSTINKYTIVWENENGTTLETDENVEYGATPSYDGATPTKEATAQYTYTFDKWSPAVAPVTGNATYTATYSSTVNQYTVIFYDEDGTTELQKQTLDYGATITQPSDPTKAATAQYTYTFNGWSPAFTPGTTVTGDAEFVATYSSTINKYTIVWENEDGTTLETDENVEYGATPSYDGVTPTKEATAQYTYTFDKWSPAVAPVTGEATYTATFSATKRSYTITWLMDDNSEIDQTVVEYGQTPSHANPTKEATAEWTYTFEGWTPEVVAVTGETTYKATFTSTKRSYLITFEDENGTVLSAELWEYGVLPECEEPTKAADDNYTYAFIGWTPEVVTVAGEATYTATYEATPKPHDPTSIPTTNDQRLTTKVLIDQHVYIIRDGRTYTVTGQEVR